jgi:hypothetical protein
MRWCRTLLLTGLLAALTVVAAVALFARHTRLGRESWEGEYGGAAVVGKSPDEITARFGKPYVLERDPPTGAVTRIVYAGPYWNYCGIEFERGAAARVTFWYK